MMRDAWNKLRVDNHILTYGSPKDPLPRYARRMMFVAHHVKYHSVLDVACGVGHLYSPLFPQVWAYKGVDSSFEMIKRAREYFPGVEFEIADAYDLSDQEEYDTVVAMSLLIHIDRKDTEKILNELWAHARKQLLFTMPIDVDFTKVMKLGRKVPESCGKTLITHISRERLDEILARLQPERVNKIPFPKGCFGYGLNDYLIEVLRR